MMLEEISKRVFALSKRVQQGDLNPLEVRLTEEYQTLRRLVADVDDRLDIDEMLNALLDQKVTKIQELARVLATPDFYVEYLKSVPIRRLAKLMIYRSPLVIARLDYDKMNASLTRVISIIDSLSKEHPKDPVPEVSEAPPDFRIESENAIFMEEMREFESTIPKGVRMPLSTVIQSDDEEVHLRRFLYVLFLISMGDLKYFKDTQEIMRE